MSKYDSLEKFDPPWICFKKIFRVLLYNELQCSPRPDNENITEHEIEVDSFQ